MNYLIKTTESWVCPNEEDAKALIESFKQNSEYELIKYTNTKKEIKSKGEVVDSYNRVDVTKSFNSEKEPSTAYTINYEAE